MRVLQINNIKRFIVALVAVVMVATVLYPAAGYAGEDDDDGYYEEDDDEYYEEDDDEYYDDDEDDDEALDTITVTLDAKGGSVSPRSLNVVEEGASVSLPTPKKSGWTFGGWYAYDYDERGYVKMSARINYDDIYAEYFKDDDDSVCVLAAAWKKAVKVKFNVNGSKGKVKKKSKNVTYASLGDKSKYGALPKASRKGYTFKGWYTKKKGGKKITSASFVAQSKSHSLYARWKKASKK